MDETTSAAAGPAGVLGLRLTRGADVRALASGLVDWLAHVSDDPFESPLVFVPGAGMRRWLSQTIARASGPEGICAGVRFENLSRLEALLSGVEDADDPWAPERVVWRILELVDAGSPGLEPLAHHLAGSEQRYANASRVARLMDGYARLRPGLLEGWSGTEPVEQLGLGFDGWQAHLWRALRAAIDAPDPVARRATLLADVAAGRRSLDAPAVALFCPRALTATQAELVGALARARRVDAWVRVDGPEDSTHPLARRLGGRGRETAALLVAQAASVVDLAAPDRPTTLLGRLQSAIDAGASADAAEPVADAAEPAADVSVRVHASHGLERQAEVLREALTAAFADDPTLEPRHVVVACADPEAFAPHLAAAFAGGGPHDPHPASSFRLKVAQRSGAAANALYRLVREIAQLAASRATASQLLGLISHPFVARRFGLGSEETERLGDLIGQASVRWGLNEAHRRDHGLDSVRQGTWQVGVQRLLLGEALGDDELAFAGTISPVDDVESSDLTAVGALAEFVSRVTRLTRRPGRDTAAGWVAHYREIVSQLTDVPFEESWQQAQLWSVLDLLERRSSDSAASLGAADALALLDAEFAAHRSRPAFGDGSLVVCGLHELAQVPHRVVCLVGLNERDFPRRGLADGDDLLARHPVAGDPDPGRDDRQALLDALAAAGERLIIVYQGWSSHTREQRPAPPGVLDLVEAATLAAGVGASSFVIDEPLQPFSPTLFSGTPRSFDQSALRAARALVRPRRSPAPERYAVGHLPELEPVSTLDLDQLKAFLVHPAKYLLKERAQLSLGDEEAPDETLPLELDSLQRWAIGDRLLGALLRGHPAQEAQHAEWLRGELPPGNLGRRVLDDVTATALRVAGDASAFADEPPGFEVIDLDIEGVRLSGRVATRGDVTLSTYFSRLSPRHSSAAWVDALALTVSQERPVDAILLGGGRRSRLSAPNPDEARGLLAALVELACEGRQRILPLPPRVGQLWAECRARNADPMADRRLAQRWEWDRDDTWTAVLPVGAKPWDALIDAEPWAQRGEKTVLGSLAALVWRPIVRSER